MVNENSVNNEAENRWERRSVREEIWRQRPLRGFFAGLVLLLAGVYGWLTFNSTFSETFSQVYWLVGMGAVMLIDEAARYLRMHIAPGSWRLFVGGGLVAVGVLVGYGVDEWWPAIVIGMGVIFIVRSLFRK